MVVPICVWSIIPISVELINNEPHECSRVYRDMALTVFRILQIILDNFWFLWAVFYCSIIVIIVHKMFKDSTIIYVLGFVITFIVPDVMHLSLYKYMYPFFIIGYFFHMHEIGIRNRIKYNISTLFLLGALYVFLMFFYNYESFIYTSGYTIWGANGIQQVTIDLYRLLVGLVGSLFVMILLYNVRNLFENSPKKIPRLLAFAGKNTIGIYIISNYIFIYILPEITSNFNSINYLFLFTETLIILILSLICIRGIKQNTILNKLLLGGR